MKNNKIKEGLEAIDRIKLMMEYSLSKTYSENLLVLSEQKSAVKILEELTDKVDKLQDKIKATEGENLDLSVEKEALQKQLIDLRKQLIEKNNELLKYSRSFSKEKFKNNSTGGALAPIFLKEISCWWRASEKQKFKKIVLALPY